MKTFRVRVYATKEVVGIFELESKDEASAMAEARKRFSAQAATGYIGGAPGMVGTEDRGWTLANSRKAGRDGPSVEEIEPTPNESEGEG